MMLLLDGSDIASLVLALSHDERTDLVILHEETFARTLGDEISLVIAFLKKHGVPLRDIHAFGTICGPGSPGALRSVVSFVNALALSMGKEVFSVVRDERTWKVASPNHPYVLPVYDRDSRTTVSKKDALGRAV